MPSFVYSLSRMVKKGKNNNFQYPVTIALNYGESELHPERVSNIKPFINKYKWKGINYLLKMDDWKTLEKNNATIALIFWTLKIRKCFQLLFQKLIRTEKNKKFS